MGEFDAISRQAQLVYIDDLITYYTCSYTGPLGYNACLYLLNLSHRIEASRYWTHFANQLHTII